jgi:hypothetical protein
MSTKKNQPHDTCYHCGTHYWMLKKCPVCFPPKNNLGVIKGVSMKGGTVHLADIKRSSMFICRIIVGDIIFLPDETMVTCHFCGPSELITRKPMVLTKEEKKSVHTLPTPEDVASFFLQRT